MKQLCIYCVPMTFCSHWTCSKITMSISSLDTPAALCVSDKAVVALIALLCACCLHTPSKAQQRHRADTSQPVYQLQALKVQYDALKTLQSNTLAQLQSTKAQLQHAEAASLKAAEQHAQAESASKAFQRSAESAEEQCRLLR